MKSGTQTEAPPSTVGAKLAIVATVEVAPEKRSQLLTILLAHRARCLKDEPGTLRFDVMLPHDDESKLCLCEVYRDAAAFDVHRNGTSIALYREESSALGAKISFSRCTLIE
jgi:quinol monooxygenase YgiN